jgi:hypothetical protein
MTQGQKGMLLYQLPFGSALFLFIQAEHAFSVQVGNQNIGISGIKLLPYDQVMNSKPARTSHIANIKCFK